METLNSTTKKLLKATERLLQKFEQERANRVVEKNKEEKRVRDLEAQVERLKKELSVEKQANKNIQLSNPKNQSHNKATLSAESIDALVKEIDACLNLLNI